MADDRDKLDKVLRKLRSVERKLDVLIEAQGLESKLREREAEDKRVAAERGEQTAAQLSRTSRGR
jgi:hypothetical protein